ncbi:MAG: hypothetical protein IKN26_02195 [Eubacterium sp.]|nr:hypothetical protein [Eubacterium sp.]MBR4241052.1 hypothetical protein [Eubacterium sp.]MBR7060476.1 hypothetical protein [Eubacterium sp.]
MKNITDYFNNRKECDILFDKESAMREYINDENMSYRKLSSKYGVSYSTIAKTAKQEDWFKKRKENSLKKLILNQNGNSEEKLSLLKKSSDKSVEALYSMVNDYEVLSINDLKNISSILKTLTAIQRDLYDLPTLKDENSIRISNEKLKLVRAKIETGGDDEKDSCGVVLIPFINDEEDENEEVVFEGEEVV